MDEIKEAGITLKQANFIKQLVQRKEGRAEPDYNIITMKEAKVLISNWLEEDGQKPKVNGVETVKPGSDEVVDILRLILAELKELNN